MQRTACTVLAVAALNASGCVYLELSLGKQPSAKQPPEEEQGQPDNPLPKTVDAEKRRRARRSKWALLAAPAELAAGAAITYLALYGTSDDADPSPDGVVGGLKDNAENSLGRAIAGTIGLVALSSGTADLLLGGTGYLLPSPFVVNSDDGSSRMIGLDEIDRAPPARVAQLDVGLLTFGGMRGVGAEADVGVAHWPSRRMRLRYSLGAGYEIAGFDSGRIDEPVNDSGDRPDLFGTMSAAVRADIAFGRRHWGRYPDVALTAIAAGRAARSEVGASHLGWRIGAGVNYGATGLLLSLSQLHGRDRYPIVELLVAGSFETD